jgi:hypothetical protein
LDLFQKPLVEEYAHVTLWARFIQRDNATGREDAA